MERIFLDNGLINYLSKDTIGQLWDNFLDITASKGLYLQDRKSFFITDEMQFLEFIGLGKILEDVPPSLLPAIKNQITNLFNRRDYIELKELNKIIDSIFSQCLIQCEALSKIKPQAILDQHKKHLGHLSSKSAKFLDQAISNQCLVSLNTNPENLYKHICRNLTWQLVTTILRTIFNEVSTKIHQDLVLRLFEPFMSTIHHAALTHGSPPNFFRLAETTYLTSIKRYEKKLSKEEQTWIMEYRQKYQTGSKKDLMDCAYLDKALLGYLDMTDGELKQLPVTVLTMDTPLQVLNRLKLLRNVLEKLKSEVNDWRLNPVYSCKVLCLERIDGCLKYKDTVEHAIQPIYI